MKLFIMVNTEKINGDKYIVDYVQMGEYSYGKFTGIINAYAGSGQYQDFIILNDEEITVNKDGNEVNGYEEMLEVLNNSGITNSDIIYSELKKYLVFDEDIMGYIIRDDIKDDFEKYDNNPFLYSTKNNIENPLGAGNIHFC